MKSLYARVEALEKQAPQNLILVVPMADGTERKMNVKEFLACAPDELADPVKDRECIFPFHIVQGNSLKDLDALLDGYVPMRGL